MSVKIRQNIIILGSDDKKEGILVANIKMNKINIKEGSVFQSFREDMRKNIYISY